MKSYNIFIAISLFLLFGGFAFFKDGLNKVESKEQIISEIMIDVANYADYSPNTLAASQQRGLTVLFFAATTWCQSCSELEKEIVERVVEIPSHITILKVDYDNDSDMKAKYQVISQHTLVVLDKDGKEVRRWVGGDFNNLVQELGNIKL